MGCCLRTHGTLLQNPISIGPPGKVIINNCELPENTRFAQIMYGSASFASNGIADTQIAGQLFNHHPYLATGNIDIVNVGDFLPTASSMMSADASCKWLFPTRLYLADPVVFTSHVDWIG